MKWLTLFFAALFVVPSPVFAQAESWCNRSDFTKGQQGWELTYEVNTYHGRYDELVGFRASLDEGLTYEFGRSIRLERDFSAALSEISFYTTTPNHDIILVDTDSAIVSQDLVNYRVALGNPTDTLRFNNATVSGTLGIEVQLSTAGEHMDTTITAIELRGYGTNPFGSTNCDLVAPINTMFSELDAANAGTALLPDNLAAPDGLNILPTDDFTEIFSYVKWIVDPASASSWAGVLAPIFIAFGILINAVVIMSAVYVGLWVIIYAVKWVIWLFRLLLQIITALAAAFDLALGWVFKIIKAL